MDYTPNSTTADDIDATVVTPAPPEEGKRVV
jgi:hypothetical protein